jgi:tetratricopeptide (TPR) repeat protein
MKTFTVISLSILMVLFLTVLVIYAQSPSEESYNKAVEYAVQGKFPMAKEEFEKALSVNLYYEPVNYYLKIINDVSKQKIKRETAIYLFKGISFTSQGHYDQAISNFNRALEINPKYEIIPRPLG